MIVDCHTHLKFGANDTDIAEHLAAAEAVDACIVLATLEGPSEEINKKLSEYINKFSDKLVGFAFVEPIKNRVNIKSLTSITEKLGLKGVVLYCSDCGFHPTHTRAMRFYESAEEIGLPVFFHNGGNNLGRNAILDYAQPYLLDEIARTFPRLKIIIGSMGLPFFEQTLSMIAKHENVFADLSIKPINIWQTYNIVIAAHEQGVINKLLFGSGYPTGNAPECIETLLGFNMFLADTNLPMVPRGNIRNIIERDTLELLGIEHKVRSPEIRIRRQQILNAKH